MSPLALAAFLGRTEVVELLLESKSLDLELATHDNEYSPLCAACMAGHLEVVELLTNNGADANFSNSLGQTPLIHCFSRLTETESVFENKTVVFRIAAVLFEFGAAVDKVAMGRTLLQSFCAISMRLEPHMLEMNLEVVAFLLEHGADPSLKCQIAKKDCFQLA